MANVTIGKNSIIYRQGSEVKEVAIIVKGNVDIYCKFCKMSAGPGTLIGLSDVASGNYLFEYVAADDVTLYTYPYENANDLKKILSIRQDFGMQLTNTIHKNVVAYLAQYNNLVNKSAELYEYLKDAYENYKELASQYGTSLRSLPAIEDLEPIDVISDVDKWMLEYYFHLNSMPQEIKKPYTNYNQAVTVGTILTASQNLVEITEVCNTYADYMKEISSLLLNESTLDLFDMYTKIAYNAYRNGDDTSAIDAAMTKLTAMIKDSYFIRKELIVQRLSEHTSKMKNLDTSDLNDQSDSDADKKILAAVTGSLDIILQYSQIDINEQDRFKKLITAYKELSDKNSSDSTARAIRKEITGLFYKIYEACAVKSFNDFIPSPVLKMFFYFGYVDEELAGPANAIALYKLALGRMEDPDKRVIPFYDWLKKIYDGEKEPSKNEFDLDYAANIREMRKKGKINEREEKALLSDTDKKVEYEMNNAFRSLCQITFGRISTFCPVFSEHNLLKDLDKTFLEYFTINRQFEKIIEVDFSAFYREVAYADEENNIPKIFIQQEILPDIILMPVIGQRGSMWQEIYGSYRHTPARFALPIFNNEDLEEICLRLVAEFRWELCKRIQGARWNDISEKSLTSEYCDYAQFYRKNSDLSPEAKEKLKLQLQKSKNSFKEVFVRDYITWIKYEATGASRLNKVARTMLFNYCPFAPATRVLIAKNPMFSDILEKYSIKRQKKAHLVDVQFNKLEKEGAVITPILEEHRKFFEI